VTNRDLPPSESYPGRSSQGRLLSGKGLFGASLLKGQMDYEYFPVSMGALDTDIIIKEISQEGIHLVPIAVDWQDQNYHPGGSIRYRFRIHDTRIVYAADVELGRIDRSGYSPREKETLIQEYADFIENADLLIADGQYTEEEYTSKVGWGHLSIPVIWNLASRAKIKQLAIFHHDPQHSDKFLDGLWAKSRVRYGGDDGEMDIFWAREGLTLAI
jgi:phosphoribosyl 1,2-cyclic phosphodiesterase